MMRGRSGRLKMRRMEFEIRKRRRWIMVKTGDRTMKWREGILGKAKILLYRGRTCKEVEDDNEENEEGHDVGRSRRMGILKRTNI